MFYAVNNFDSTKSVEIVSDDFQFVAIAAEEIAESVDSVWFNLYYDNGDYSSKIAEYDEGNWYEADGYTVLNW